MMKLSSSQTFGLYHDALEKRFTFVINGLSRYHKKYVWEGCHNLTYFSLMLPFERAVGVSKLLTTFFHF